MTIKTELVPLGDVVDCDHDSADKALSESMRIIGKCIDEFPCAKSGYHERFIKSRAQTDHMHSSSRTYLLLNAEYVKPILDGTITPADYEYAIAAYFTIGLSSVMSDKPGLSNALKKIIGSGQYKNNNTVGCFVIGELCRSSAYGGKDLPGCEILETCLDSIRDARVIVGGRIVQVESRKRVYDCLYNPRGFKVIEVTDRLTDDGEPLISSILKLK